MEDFPETLGRVALVETQELVLEDLMLALRDDFLFPGHNNTQGAVKPESDFSPAMGPQKAVYVITRARSPS